jgi:Domain of unknown function (DUF222)/Phage capsid family
MRDSLPKVAEVFVAGDKDFRTFQTIVYRTGLIEDEHMVAVADRRLAARAPRWGLMSQSRLNAAIDRVVRSVDVDAVRRKRERARDRELTVWPNDDGMADVAGTLFAGDGTVLDQQLDALADSVCDADPRNRSQRRADALGALAAGHERLSCRCGSPGCPAGVVNPATWGAVRRTKDSMNLYLVTPDPAADEPETIWGVVVLSTTTCPEGTAVLIDSSKFGRVAVRTPLEMRIGYAYVDGQGDFTSNILRYVCEERLILARERPSAVLSLTGLPNS